MSISGRRLQRAHQSQLYVGWDIASNGIDWSNVEWSAGLDSLVLLGTSTLVTAGNKSQWEQFATPGASRVVYQSRFGNSSPSCFIKYFDYGSGINTALNSYKNNGAASRWPVLCHKVWNLADPTQDIADLNTTLNYFGTRSMPWVLVYYQEPQWDGQSGVPEAQPSYYCDVYTAMDQVRASSPYGQYCSLMKCLFYPLRGVTNSNYFWPAYHGGQTFDRFYVGMDAYSDERKTAPMTGQELCGEIAAWSQAAGVPGVVPEFGMAQNYGVIKNNNTNVFGTFLTGAERRAALMDVIDYCQDNNFAWINYWNPNSDCSVTNSGYAHWELTEPETIDYWSNRMNSNPHI